MSRFYGSLCHCQPKVLKSVGMNLKEIFKPPTSPAEIAFSF